MIGTDMRNFATVLDTSIAPHARVGVTGHGTFLLTSRTERTTPTGQRALHLTLEDSRGRITGLMLPEAPEATAPPRLPAPVTVLAAVERHASETVLRVFSLAMLDPGDVGCVGALLPTLRCPPIAHIALIDLTELEIGLPTPLRDFVRRVLLDPEITLPFLNCRASVAHHHAYPGGLLVHSTEMLQAVQDCAKRVLPRDPWAPYLAAVAYLFHDLGKVRSVGTTRRPQYGLVARHELLTIELLASHLRWLERRTPRLAAALRYVFGYLAMPQFARPALPQYEIARIVAQYDQWSAASFAPHDLEYLLQTPFAAKRLASQRAIAPVRVRSQAPCSDNG